MYVMCRMYHCVMCHGDMLMLVGTRMNCSFKTLPGAPNDLLCEFLPGVHKMPAEGELNVRGLNRMPI